MPLGALGWVVTLRINPQASSTNWTTVVLSRETLLDASVQLTLGGRPLRGGIYRPGSARSDPVIVTLESDSKLVQALHCEPV